MVAIRTTVIQLVTFQVRMVSPVPSAIVLTVEHLPKNLSSNSPVEKITFVIPRPAVAAGRACPRPPPCHRPG